MSSHIFCHRQEHSVTLPDNQNRGELKTLPYAKMTLRTGNQMTCWPMSQMCFNDMWFTPICPEKKENIQIRFNITFIINVFVFFIFHSGNSFRSWGFMNGHSSLYKTWVGRELDLGSGALNPLFSIYNVMIALWGNAATLRIQSIQFNLPKE